MTFRYCQLAVGRNLSTKRGIDWREVSAVVPCDEEWEELNPGNEISLWTKRVKDYRLSESVLYVRLEGCGC